jgi:hypothetical protein
LGITTIVSPTAGKQKLDSYLEPINQLLDAIDTKQIGLKEASRIVAQCGVQWYTQAKLLGGLRSLYDVVKTKVFASAHGNPIRELDAYLNTSDGTLLKSTTDALDPALNTPDTLHSLQITADGRLTHQASFAIKDTLCDIFTQNNDVIKNIVSLINGNALKHGITRLLTVLNAQLTMDGTALINCSLVLKKKP